MAFEFRLPDIGEGVVEGEVVKWLVREGDTIREDQPMVEVMTDKATVEIPSPKAGRVAKILAAEGKTCAVGAVMVVIEESAAGGKTVTTTTPSAATPATSSGHAKNGSGNGHASSIHATGPAATGTAGSAPRMATGSPSGAGGKVLATPSTRKLARDLGVSLHTISPTGENGRVLADDVRRAAQGVSAHGTAGTTTSVRAPLPPVTITRDATDERIPFRGVRKKIAENMHRSRQTAAHFTYVEECDVTNLIQLRKKSNSLYADRGVKLSFLPFIVQAVCAALKRFPIVNATLDEATQEIVLRKRYHIGVAAATGEGLIVPVVRDADRRSVFDIAKTLEELSEKAKVGKATREDLTGSTFTISSLGTLGGVLATPIINYPEVAILGVHKIKQAPVVRDGQIVVRDVMNLSISLDHRVVDGYEGAQFLQHVIALLEEPALLLMEAT